MNPTVDHLKKVRLEVRFDGRTVPFDFIFGVASDGMCPFEYKLLHKTVGHRLHLIVPQTDAPGFFAHLYLPLRAALSCFGTRETYDLAIAIAAVTDPDQREVVRALAQATENEGCGGNCGCGCGGH